LKRPITPTAGGMAQNVDLEFKPQYQKKERKKKLEETASTNISVSEIARNVVQ
jgi:hypothetical protein